VGYEAGDGDFVRGGVEVGDWAMVAVISICGNEAASPISTASTHSIFMPYFCTNFPNSGSLFNGSSTV
jgi:hypothetical protein